MEKPQCKFEGVNGDKCNRRIFESTQVDFEPYCIFHYGCNQKSNEDILDNPQFQEDFDEIINSGDGEWIGFVFPTGIKLPKIIPFAVDARECRLNSVELDNVTFKESVDFSGSVFKKSLIIKNTNFESSAKFERCQFEGIVEFLFVHFKGTSSFAYADFAKRTLLKTQFKQKAKFNEAIFQDVTIFSGWQNTIIEGSSPMIHSNRFFGAEVTLGGSSLTIKQKIKRVIQKINNLFSKIIEQVKTLVINLSNKTKSYFRQLSRKYAKSDPSIKQFKMFEEEAHFQGVIFLKPDKILFSQVILSKVHFSRTNLRGIRFVGVDWWQPDLKRNGLYDELFIGKSSDGAFRHLNLPMLEETSRNARIALEENKSFNVASDFYVAEMEAVHQQLNFFEKYFFSVIAAYRFVSLYGTSVGTAIRVLILIYLLHVVSSLYLHTPLEFTSLLNEFWNEALRSIKVLLLMQPEIKNNSQSWLDVGLRIAGPIQIAMVAIAFRARIKRH